MQEEEFQMKAITRTRCRNIILSIFVLASFSLISFEANACHCYKKHHHRWCHPLKPIKVPTATCTTHATGKYLPMYVCCKLLDNRGRAVWKNNWVSGSCQNADMNAMYSRGCSATSPVYGTNAPIMANCQFSFSTK